MIFIIKGDTRKGKFSASKITIFQP